MPEDQEPFGDPGAPTPIATGCLIEGRIYSVGRTDMVGQGSFRALYHNGWFWPLERNLHPSRIQVIAESPSPR